MMDGGSLKLSAHREDQGWCRATTSRTAKGVVECWYISFVYRFGKRKRVFFGLAGICMDMDIKDFASSDG